MTDQLRESRRYGMLWLGTATLLCCTAILLSIWSGARKGASLDAARVIYLSVTAGTIWSIAVLQFRKEYSLSKAGPLNEAIALSHGPSYRLIGSLSIASPYCEMATLLYMVATGIMNVSRMMSFAALFGSSSALSP